MKISVIVPVYNEGASVMAAHDALVTFLRAQLPHMAFEIIFVDDGSRDDSFAHLEFLAKKYSYVRVIKFASNAGSHMAIRAGLENARGDMACFVACDLQDPPEILALMLKFMSDKVQIVWAVRNTRQDSLASRFFAAVFYFFARLIVSKNIPPSGASMFLLGFKALKALSLYKERNLTLEGLFATMGFQNVYVPYERRIRTYGKSKWTLGKRLKLFIDFFVAYTYTPIRLMSFCGLTLALIGFIYAAVVIFNKIFFSTPVGGWTSLMVVVLLIGGFQMIMMGIIGEYLWRTLDESRGRPRYIVEKILND